MITERAERIAGEIVAALEARDWYVKGLLRYLGDGEFSDKAPEGEVRALIVKVLQAERAYAFAELKDEFTRLLADFRLAMAEYMKIDYISEKTWREHVAPWLRPEGTEAPQEEPRRG